MTWGAVVIGIAAMILGSVFIVLTWQTDRSNKNKIDIARRNSIKEREDQNYNPHSDRGLPETERKLSLNNFCEADDPIEDNMADNNLLNQLPMNRDNFESQCRNTGFTNEVAFNMH